MNTTITGTITEMERRQNTVDANPRWTVTVNTGHTDFTFKTKDDTACAYIPDFHHKGKVVTLTLDGRKQITGYELEDQ